MTETPSTERQEFPREPTTAAGTCTSWTVEARCVLPRPREISGITLDSRWQEVAFPTGHGYGVPDGPRWMFEGRNFGHLSYAAAQALRWWFIANAVAAMQDNGLETRLIRHSIEYKRSAAAVDAVEPTDGRSHRVF